MLAQIGHVIAAERARQHLGVGDLGVDPRVVEAIEEGTPGITSIQLEAIAEALQLDPLALHRGERVARPKPSIFLRHHALQDFDSSDGAVLDSALEQARARNLLSSMVGHDVGLFPRGTFQEQPAAADQPNAPAKQGYLLARDLRRAIKNERKSLVDLQKLIEDDIGIVMVVHDMRTLGISATSVKAGELGAVVLPPRTSSNDAFTRGLIAHELGHLLFDPSDGSLNIVVDFDVDRHPHQAEQRARAFAAELLVPDAGVRNLIGPPSLVSASQAAIKLVATVRDHFGATWQVTANHLCNLGYIHLDLRDWLERTSPLPGSRAWSTRLPRAGGASVRVEQLVRLAHEAGHITDGEARDILGLDSMVALPWKLA